MSEQTKRTLDCDRVRKLIAAALEEDIGSGDVTSNALVARKETVTASIMAREDLVVATGGLVGMIFDAMGIKIAIDQHIADGESAKAGDCVLELHGPAQAILTAERTLLNFLQRMSGIATLTKRYVEAVAGSDVDILDTRKTTPGLREIAKYSVSCGGGTNHRMGLYDKAMVKDNHRVFWSRHGTGGLTGAVERIREMFPNVEVEVEVDNEDELREALKSRPEWILLDNMAPETLRRCVEINGGTAKLEASGGISLATVRAVAETGVDAISVGALTHSAVAVDLALDFNDI